jgi:hypothetical protein
MARFALMGALLSASAAGLAITTAERSQGRLMRGPDHNSSWPAWYYGPNNQSDTFASPEDVPAGWKDHPSLVEPEKVITPARTGSKPIEDAAGASGGVSKAATGAGPKNPGDQSNTLDAAGWPWDAKLHAASKSMTKAGLWRMKVGVVRPEPKPTAPPEAVEKQELEAGKKLDL